MLQTLALLELKLLIHLWVVSLKANNRASKAFPRQTLKAATRTKRSSEIDHGAHFCEMY